MSRIPPIRGGPTPDGGWILDCSFPAVQYKPAEEVSVPGPHAWLRDVAHELVGLEASLKRVKAGDPLAWAAWYVHARALDEFFFSPPSSEHPDIRLSDLLPTEAVDRVRSAQAKPPNYAKLWKSAGYLVAHLSKERAVDRARGRRRAPSGRITDYLLRTAEVFEAELERGGLAKSFRRHRDQMRRHFGLTDRGSPATPAAGSGESRTA